MDHTKDGDEIPELRLPQEYSISGWFIFAKGRLVEDWHTGFKVSIKKPASDNVIGDRSLYYSIGKAEQIIWTTTYSYKNMKGEGDLSLKK